MVLTAATMKECRTGPFSVSVSSANDVYYTDLNGSVRNKDIRGGDRRRRRCI